MDGNIDKVREALEKARDALYGTEINMSNYGDEEVLALNQASTVAWWAIRDTLSALYAIDPEAHLDGMDDEERIVLLLEHIGESWGKDDGHDVQLVRDAFSLIRRECADKAVAWSRLPFPDGMDCKSLEEAMEYIESGLYSAVFSAKPVPGGSTASKRTIGVYTARVKCAHIDGCPIPSKDRCDNCDIYKPAQDDGKPEVEPRLLACSTCGDIETAPYEQGDTCPMCGIGVYRSAEIKRRLEEAEE